MTSVTAERRVQNPADDLSDRALLLRGAEAERLLRRGVDANAEVMIFGHTRESLHSVRVRRQ